MMRIKTLADRYLYVPNRLKGESTFEGNPIVSDRVKNIIDEDGVNFITQKLHNFSSIRKEMYGNNFKEYYGMYFKQYVFDLKLRLFFKIEEILDDDSHNFKVDLYREEKEMEDNSNIGAYRLITRGRVFTPDSF